MQEGQYIAGRYRLEKIIGRGAMSVVWRAADTRTGGRVAVKEQRFDKKARRAAEALAKIDHPCVAKVHECSRDWLVMEYIDGFSLADVLKNKGRIPAEQAAGVGADIASGLEAMHAAGLMHRDVKPGNIMIATGTGIAKLVDFGISRPAHDDPTRSGVVGAPAYLAPEMADGKEDPTPAADVFSLGATLFRAVEGVPVYGYGATDSPLRMIGLAREGEISEPRRAGVLAPALRWMLRADPAQRPAPEAARQLLAEACPGAVPLTELGRGRQRPTGWVRRVRMLRWPSGRRARAATAGGGAAALAVILLAFALWPPQGGGVPRPDAAAPALALGNPRTADPCSLMMASAFNGFGDPSLSTDYGNFNRCDVIVQGSGGSVVDVELELEVPGWYPDPSLSQKPLPRTVRIVRGRSTDKSCDRPLILPDRNLVLINARQTETGHADLCAMADTQDRVALTSLRTTGVRRRAPLGAASLSNLNACPLLDTRALQATPGIAGSTRKQGFADWACRWDSNSVNSYVNLLFDQGRPLDTSDGHPVRLHGLMTYIQPYDDGTGTCVAQMVYRQYTDSTGQTTQDRVRLTFGGDGTESQLCTSVTRLADDVAVHLAR